LLDEKGKVETEIKGISRGKNFPLIILLIRIFILKYLNFMVVNKTKIGDFIKLSLFPQ